MKITAEERGFILNQRALAATQDQCREWFENHLFGLVFDKQEKDTRIESEIYEAIVDFLDGYYMRSNKKELIDFFKKLMNCKDYYSLLTPQIKYAYRGIGGSYIGFKKPKKIINHPATPQGKMYVYDFTYKPKDIVQSWTASEIVASHFAAGCIGSKDYDYADLEYLGEICFPSAVMKGKLRPKKLPMIIKARVDDSFFGSTELTNKLYYLLQEDRQDEVFRIGKVIPCEVLVPAIWLQ